MARYAIAATGAVVLVVLMVVGGIALDKALFGKPDTTGPKGINSSSATPNASQGIPKQGLYIQVNGNVSIYVADPAGNIYVDRQVPKGNVISVPQPHLTATVSDGSLVNVYISGQLQQHGPAGQPQSFKIG